MRALSLVTTLFIFGSPLRVTAQMNLVVGEGGIVSEQPVPDPPVSGPPAEPNNGASFAEKVAVPPKQPSPISTTVITPAPTVPSPDQSYGGGPGDLSIAIENKYGQPLSISFGCNEGAPGFVGNPQPTQIAESASYAVPSGWAGRISIGKDLHSDNSKIEGSYYGPGKGDIDVSYVDGYSVPITCSIGGETVTGCNIELFDQECAYPDTLVSNGNVCQNSQRTSDWGPASPFFAPCAGAAYTFPKDDQANIGEQPGTLMQCCLGKDCTAPKKQKAQKRQQSLHQVLHPRHPIANSPSLLPRSHKLHGKRSARAGLHVHGHLHEKLT